MPTDFITGEIDGNKFSAFVTKSHESCIDGKEHDDNGEMLYTFHNREGMLTQSQVDALPENERNELNFESGQVSCSKCKLGAMQYQNPYLM